MNLAPETPNCWYLTGPTASGKTTVGLELAERLNAEIISLDSMAIYRGMNVGTAKPTREQRARVPHHLIDIRDPTERFSVTDYLAAASTAIADIGSRDKQVLFVGGTPLYLKALLRGMFEGPPGDEGFRREVLREAEQVGLEALHARLQQVDPLSAARLHPRDVRRIVRALEVYTMTGEPISHHQLQFDEGTPADQCRVFVLDWPRKTLHQRINARVARMYASGLVEEVRGLLDRYGALSQTAAQAVGYREVQRHLRERTTLDETIRMTEARTRQFAKRQLTWFRSLCECRWLAREEDQPRDELIERIVAVGQPVVR
jgi:tRNA dimethylallyltransferase